MTVLAIAEHRRGELREVSLELLAASRKLADATDGGLHVGVVSGDIERYTERLNREDVDVVHTVAYGEEFNHDVYTQAVTQLVEAVEPTVVLAPNTVNGLDYLPAVAERLDIPIVTDATELSYDEHLTVTRELYGGKVETTLDIDTQQAAVTIRPGSWPRAGGTGDAEISAFDARIDESAVRSTVTGFQEIGGEVDIAEADVLVAVGRGIESEDNLEIVRDLADALDATLAASRPVIDNGWLPADRQVGQSGKTVSPELYIAVGISGTVQHVSGVRAETFIAINDDPNAPIFEVADYGVVDDLFEVVPALTEQLTRS
ncbi:electron transfer flavoprotein subunit alpha/FixB family protein [Halapricum hydrolyticum]|uniref:Electron transfer flavoprotein subunit alpha/FixB family protein n=1 Tax=Halapricum hydrolyticum TaxID=2979991 RepID=A0AAE3LEZ4_9EURY|nr:electron transfer flavoprotein subunit alpha/FixB family protein [Halapricum hydrolyticum]MCU4717842.1 electron transfer flavoprotein subunit alpha/FixB family protein [Halapricum hydrolyticum]MCU4727006.1 electron transfer flavoprotein subunit alpha/FixB family protein [Halapricum hydrolyticum]